MRSNFFFEGFPNVISNAQFQKLILILMDTSSQKKISDWWQTCALAVNCQYFMHHFHYQPSQK